MAALPQVTGTAQNETQAATRTFARNANGVDVRGLGPGRTLILVDGRRMTDYPLPYGGTSNFVNLSAIPAAAVERIEVLAGGASAIYGSDAVAGVINIILKKKTDAPFNVDLRYGDTTQGGGQSLRLQGVASLTSGRLSTLFAAELFKRDPIYAFQRDFQDSVQDNPDPDGRINSRSILRLEPYYTDENGFNYVDPGEAACDAFPTLTYSFRPGAGYYCGDEHGISQYTLRNARQRGSLFGRVSYELDNAELYGSLHYYKSSDRLDSNLTFFSTDFILPEGYFFDVSEDPNDVGGNYGLMQRYFQPAETGGYRARQSHYREQVIDYSAGVRGNIRGAWKYDLTLGGSEYDVKSRRELLLNKSLLDYFLGPQLTDGSGNPLYDPQVDYFPVYSVRWTGSTRRSLRRCTGRSPTPTTPPRHPTRGPRRWYSPATWCSCQPARSPPPWYSKPPGRGTKSTWTSSCRTVNSCCATPAATVPASAMQPASNWVFRYWSRFASSSPVATTTTTTSRP